VAALPAVAAIPVIKSTQSGAMFRDVMQVAEKDYLHVLRSIATQETERQVALGNPPSGLLVDGKRSKSIDEARFNVVVWFASRADLAQAILDAKAALEKNGRRVTGATLGAMQFYYSVGAQGVVQKTSDPRGVAMNAKNPASLDLYVTIPVKHVRKWQWYGSGGQRLKRKTRNKALKRYLLIQGRKAWKVSMSVFELSAAQVQRRYRSLDVAYIFLDVGDLGQSGTIIDRIPAIMVRLKVRGRGR
jgi:hypothetical protein